MLEVMVHRVKQSKLVNEVIIATTTNKQDDEIIEFCEKNSVAFYRGSEENVFQRVLQTHQQFQSDVIVELTGDCPLLDATLIDEAIEVYLNNEYDYVSNGIKESYPIGMGVQVYSLKSLEKIASGVLSAMDKEHVTPQFYTTDKFTKFNIFAPDKHYFPELSLTLDTKEDYEMICKVYEHFNNKDIPLEKLISYVKQNKQLLNINGNIHRKGLS